MAIQVATTRTTPGSAQRQRPMRNTRLVSLRSSLPTGLVTLRHDVPEYLSQSDTTTGEPTEVQQDATPKVEKGGGAVRAAQTRIRIETAARKGS